MGLLISDRGQSDNADLPVVSYHFYFSYCQPYYLLGSNVASCLWFG